MVPLVFTWSARDSLNAAVSGCSGLSELLRRKLDEPEKVMLL